MEPQNLPLLRLPVLLFFPLEHSAIPRYWKGVMHLPIRETVLDAGFSSRSGIGATDVLQRNNIPQVVGLPGVGENFLGRIHFPIS
jgi:hypothetical protein